MEDARKVRLDPIGEKPYTGGGLLAERREGVFDVRRNDVERFAVDQAIRLERLQRLRLSGKRTYIITTRRITSGEELK